jgi:predicted Zn-dependent protease
MKLYQGTKFPEAAEAFRRSLAADPDFASSQLRLGMSLLLSGKREEGVRWIGRAATRGDKLPERDLILSEAIQSAFREQKDPKAPALLEKLTERYPNDPESLFWQAELRSAQEGTRFEAIRILHQAVDQNPNDALAVSALVRHLKELGLDKDAAAILADFRKRNSAPAGDLTPPATKSPETPPRKPS